MPCINASQIAAKITLKRQHALETSASLILDTAGNSAIEIGSLEGDSTTSVVRLRSTGSNHLVLGATISSATNGGSLRNNANFAGHFDGVNLSLTKVGENRQILSGSDNTVDSVEVQRGTLVFDQSTGVPNSPTPFNVTGNYTTAAGAGALSLGAVNGYTGSTEISQGKLSLIGVGSIANSSVVNLSTSDATLDISAISGDRTQVQNLMGARGIRVDFGAKIIEVNSSSDTTMMGDLVGNDGLVKNGVGSLTLSGQTAWASDTYLNEGQLILDGSAGKARLVSNVIGQAGSSLQLTNGAQLTGWIDPTQVWIDRASLWTKTADSD